MEQIENKQVEVDIHASHLLHGPHWGLKFQTADVEQTLVQLHDQTDYKRIEFFLETRPSLQTLILRGANQARSARVQPLETVRHALAFLGTVRARDLLLEARRHATATASSSNSSVPENVAGISTHKPT